MPVKVPTAGMTVPKAGRLGSGAFYRTHGHHPSMTGNIFGPNWDVNETQTPAYGTSFGTPNQALLSTTGVGRSPNNPNSAQYPLNTHFQTASYNKLNMLASGTGTRTASPVATPQARKIAPWESTVLNPTGRVSVKRSPYRATGGVNNSLPSDTAFKRRPPKHVAKAAPAVNSDTSALAGRNFNISNGGVKTLPSGHRISMHSTLFGNASNPIVQGHQASRSRWAQVSRGAGG